ncbi:hypothetical protein Hanom_Chr16g01451091 [Helianthus anomalus]
MLIEIIEEHEQTIEEEVEDEGEICFDETPENSNRVYSSSKEMLQEGLRSMMSPELYNVFCRLLHQQLRI